MSQDHMERLDATSTITMGQGSFSEHVCGLQQTLGRSCQKWHNTRTDSLQNKLLTMVDVATNWPELALIPTANSHSCAKMLDFCCLWRYIPIWKQCHMKKATNSFGRCFKSFYPNTESRAAWQMSWTWLHNQLSSTSATGGAYKKVVFYDLFKKIQVHHDLALCELLICNTKFFWKISPLSITTFKCSWIETSGWGK